MENIKIEEKLDEAMDVLVETIIKDYSTFITRSFRANGYKHTTPEAKTEEFRENIKIKEGSKYIKITTENSVWGFINKKNPSFKFGDIFMAKSYAAPALNKSRGNIFEDNYKHNIAWTGPKYLPGSTGMPAYEIHKSSLPQQS